MKEILTILTLTLSLIGIGQSNTIKVSTGSFPESWDQDRNVRGVYEAVAWTHRIVKWNKKGLRSCLMVKVIKDSLDSNIYTVCEKYADTPPLLNGIMDGLIMDLVLIIK